MGSFISKVELKKQLIEMGVVVEGNYVRKKDIDKILGSIGKNERFLITSVTWLKKAIDSDQDKKAILKVLNELADKLSGQGIDEKDPSVIEALDDLEYLLSVKNPKSLKKDPMFAKPVSVLSLGFARQGQRFP